MATRGRKIALGCLFGCGSLAILVMVAIGFGVYWITRPGELLEPERLLGRESNGFLEWTLRLEDPGTEEFVELLADSLGSLNRLGGGALPPGLTSLLNGAIDKESRDDLRDLFPVAAAWSMQPGTEPSTDVHLLTVSLSSAGNQIRFVDWVLGLTFGFDEDTRVVEYRGEEILSFPDEGLAFFIRGNDLFFSGDLEMAQAAVDRLLASTVPGAEHPPLAELLPTAQGTLRGALRNDRGEIARLWRTFSPDVPEELELEQIRSVRVAGGLEPAGALGCRVTIEGPDEEWAGRQAEGLSATLRQLLESAGPEVEAQSRIEGNSVVVKLTVRDLIGYWRSLLERERDAA